MNEREKTIRLWFDMWLNQRDSIKFLYTSIVHFIFEIPLHNRLISLMKKLLDFPNDHLATGIPFLKPMLYCFSVEWTEDNKIKALKEFGCNRNTYNPYQEGDTPQFKAEKANWF